MQTAEATQDTTSKSPLQPQPESQPYQAPQSQQLQPPTQQPQSQASYVVQPETTITPWTSSHPNDASITPQTQQQMQQSQQIQQLQQGQQQYEDLNRGWQKDSDINERKMMIPKIVYVLQQRNPSAPPEWIKRLQQMAKRLEESLYRSANSLLEYKDATTLKIRLGQVAVKIAMKTKTFYQQQAQQQQQDHPQGQVQQPQLPVPLLDQTQPQMLQTQQVQYHPHHPQSQQQDSVPQTTQLPYFVE